MIHELLLIEDEARDLKLDQVASIALYFGGDPAHIATAKSLQNKWFVARAALMASAAKVLGANPASVEFSAVNTEWLETLASFRRASDEINSTVTLQALENLKKSFSDSGSAGKA